MFPVRFISHPQALLVPLFFSSFFVLVRPCSTHYLFPLGMYAAFFCDLFASLVRVFCFASELFFSRKSVPGMIFCFSSSWLVWLLLLLCFRFFVSGTFAFNLICPVMWYQVLVLVEVSSVTDSSMWLLHWTSIYIYISIFSTQIHDRTTKMAFLTSSRDQLSFANFHLKF